MRVLVTGAFGFIGSYLVEELLRRGDEVHALDSRCRAAVNELLVRDLLPAGAIRVLDVRDSAGLSRLPEYDVVYHLAAESHVEVSIGAPLDALSSNAVGTAEVAYLCARRGSALVYCSTDEVYGDLRGTDWEAAGADEEATPLRPSSPYSAGKAAGELCVHAFSRTYGLRAAVARGSNAWGARQHGEKLVPKACRILASGGAFPVHDGGLAVRQWIHVEEFARALSLLGAVALRAAPGSAPRAYNLAGPRRAPVRELLEALRARLGGLGSLEDGHRRAGQDLSYHVSGERARVDVGFIASRDILDPAELDGLLLTYGG